jgi:isopentenyl diphosphate isomerase/L-lactate dehydrogenase-like FMN-dependent dehydrogenase
MGVWLKENRITTRQWTGMCGGGKLRRDNRPSATGVYAVTSNFLTLQDLVLAAHERLGKDVWDFVTFGTESETTIRRNRRALDSLAWLPRILRDVSKIDPGTSLLGEALRIPVLLSPIGSIARLDREGALAAARAVGTFGTLQFLSSHAEAEVAALRTGAALPLIYALHPYDDPAALDDEIDRVKAGGYRAISVATQSGYYSRRERDLMNGFVGKVDPLQSYAGFLRRERATGGVAELRPVRLSWAMLDRIRARSGMKVVLKGVLTAADARLAVEHGVDVVYVSNNGGRSLDHARAAIVTLPEIVAAVAGRAEVIVDGGFVRGSDVLKAIALGARAVCMGRMQAWALAASGEAGVVRMLEILEEEIVVTMGHVGVNRLDELGPEYVSVAEFCGMAHPLGAFPVVMERLYGVQA